MERKSYDPFGYEGYTVGTPDSSKMPQRTRSGAMAAIAASPQEIEQKAFVRKKPQQRPK